MSEQRYYPKGNFVKHAIAFSFAPSSVFFVSLSSIPSHHLSETEFWESLIFEIPLLAYSADLKTSYFLKYYCISHLLLHSTYSFFSASLQQKLSFLGFGASYLFFFCCFKFRWCGKEVPFTPPSCFGSRLIHFRVGHRKDRALFLLHLFLFCLLTNKSTFFFGLRTQSFRIWTPIFRVRERRFEET